MFLVSSALAIEVNETSFLDWIFQPQYIFTHTNETIPLVSQNVWANVTFTQETTDVIKGIQHDHIAGDSQHFNITESGIYEISYTLDVEDTSTGASNIDVAGRVIYINGTEIDGSIFETDVTKQGVEVELSHNFLARILAGEVIVFQFVAQDADVRISTHGTFGDSPESASVVIKKIANL